MPSSHEHLGSEIRCGLRVLDAVAEIADDGLHMAAIEDSEGFGIIAGRGEQ